MKWVYKFVKRMRRRLEVRLRRLRKRHARTGILALSLAAITGVLVYTTMRTPPIDPVVYRPLLNTIAKGESNGNYNAYFGSSDNATVRFTDMTIAEVIAWQERYVADGSVSSAVGKYQIIRSTLQGLVTELNLDSSAVLFDESTQDRLAVALLERRGSVAFIEQKISREQFAANLAKEWAALPRVLGGDPNESYYAADGVNKARVSVDEIYGALSPLRAIVR